MVTVTPALSRAIRHTNDSRGLLEPMTVIDQLEEHRTLSMQLLPPLRRPISTNLEPHQQLPKIRCCNDH